MNNRDFSIDKINRDYDFSHNLAALIELVSAPLPVNTHGTSKK